MHIMKRGSDGRAKRKCQVITEDGADLKVREEGEERREDRERESRGRVYTG